MMMSMTYPDDDLAGRSTNTCQAVYLEHERLPLLRCALANITTNRPVEVIEFGIRSVVYNKINGHENTERIARLLHAARNRN